MKHPEELKTKFVELRARGVSYGRISEELGVSKPTLMQWGKAMADTIADLQAAEREIIREKLLGSFEQWLGRQLHHFNRLDAEFGRREFKYSPTESVFRMLMASRKALDRYFFDNDKPSRRTPRTSEAASSPLARAAETQFLGETDDPKLGQDETGSLGARMEMQNQTISGPFLDQKEGGSSSEGSRSSAPAEAQNPTIYPPFIHQKEGGSASAPSPLCVEARADESSVYSENPAKTLPFPCQNSEVDNFNLSSHPSTQEVADLSNRGSGAIGNSGSTPHWCPRRPEQRETAASSGTDQPSPTPVTESQIGHPKPKTSLETRYPLSPLPMPASQMENAESEDFQGESIPINPYESTREWLERQGIKVSKIPEGARIIAAT